MMIDVERKKGKEARPGGAGQIQIIFARRFGGTGEGRRGGPGYGRTLVWWVWGRGNRRGLNAHQ